MEEKNQIDDNTEMKDESQTFYEKQSKANDTYTSKEEDENIKKERSILSLEGGKKPFSLYTRRVINTSNIRDYFKEDSSHGLCGSMNLGNTCFMNSSIACLSNCIELTSYFLSGDYLKDINRENKLGMGGDLAECWGQLMKEYWILHTNVGDPSDLKKIFGQKIKRFSGSSQQDSNEFIDLFLDYLNEDLNAVTNKQYIEIKEKGENETDVECSKRFWDNYLKRNDSIVTDLFCGQFKCTVSCPECNLVKIIFDPFNSLNLNLPEKKNNFINSFIFFYVPKYCLRTPIKVVFQNISKNATFEDCFENLKKMKKFKYHKKINKLITNKISDKKSIKFINQEDKTTIEHYNDENHYFCYDILDENDNIKIPIYFKEYKSNSEFPRIIMVSRENSNLDDLRNKIYFNIRKFILSTLKKENEESDFLSEEIKKYNTDINIEDNYIFELIDQEYKVIFDNNYHHGEDSEEYNECIKNFLENIPFNLYLTKDFLNDKKDKIYIINENYFTNLSPQFTELTGIKTYNDPITNLLNVLNNEHYYIVLEFKRNSNYINEKLFKLNTCVKCILDYPEEKEEGNDIMTLKKLFELFTKEEKLKQGDEWYCPRCKEHVLAKKKMEIFYLPKILIICFKRFIKNSYSWKRNDEMIYFPIENLDMKEFVVGPDKDHSKYDLFAVSQHFGDTGYGHYTAICKNLNKWYSYNDSSVHETSSDNILSSSAYVLFYRRQTD